MPFDFAPEKKSRTVSADEAARTAAFHKRFEKQNTVVQKGLKESMHRRADHDAALRGKPAQTPEARELAFTASLPRVLQEELASIHESLNDLEKNHTGQKQGDVIRQTIEQLTASLQDIKKFHRDHPSLSENVEKLEARIEKAQHLARLYDKIDAHGLGVLDDEVEEPGDSSFHYLDPAAAKLAAADRSIKRDKELQEAISAAKARLKSVDEGSTDKDALLTKGHGIDDLTLPYAERIRMLKAEIENEFTHFRGTPPTSEEFEAIVHGLEEGIESPILNPHPSNFEKLPTLNAALNLFKRVYHRVTNVIFHYPLTVYVEKYKALERTREKALYEVNKTKTIQAIQMDLADKARHVDLDKLNELDKHKIQLAKVPGVAVSEVRRLGKELAEQQKEERKLAQQAARAAFKDRRDIANAVAEERTANDALNRLRTQQINDRLAAKDFSINRIETKAEEYVRDHFTKLLGEEGGLAYMEDPSHKTEIDQMLAQEKRFLKDEFQQLAATGDEALFFGEENTFQEQKDDSRLEMQEAPVSRASIRSRNPRFQFPDPLNIDTTLRLNKSLDTKQDAYPRTPGFIFPNSASIEVPVKDEQRLGDEKNTDINAPPPPPPPPPPAPRSSSKKDSLFATKPTATQEDLDQLALADRRIKNLADAPEITEEEIDEDTDASVDLLDYPHITETETELEEPTEDAPAIAIEEIDDSLQPPPLPPQKKGSRTREPRPSVSEADFGTLTRADIRLRKKGLQKIDTRASAKTSEATEALPDLDFNPYVNGIDEPKLFIQDPEKARMTTEDMDTALERMIEQIASNSQNVTDGKRANYTLQILDTASHGLKNWNQPAHKQSLAKLREKRAEYLSFLQKSNTPKKMRESLLLRMGIIDDILQLTSKHTKKAREAYVLSRSSQEGELAVIPKEPPPDEILDPKERRQLESRLAQEMTIKLKNLMKELIHPTHGELVLHLYKAATELPITKQVDSWRDEWSQNTHPEDTLQEKAITQVLETAAGLAVNTIKGTLPRLQRLAGNDRQKLDEIATAKTCLDSFESILLLPPKERKNYVVHEAKKDYAAIQAELAALSNLLSNSTPRTLEETVEEKRRMTRLGALTADRENIKELAEDLNVQLEDTRSDIESDLQSAA